MTVTAQSPTVQSFLDALHTLEADHDPGPLAALVTPDADVLSIDGHGPREGPEGMSELFTQYLDQFDRIETTFTRINENDAQAALEWSSDAELTGGHPVTYTGITILDHTHGAITRFRTVYDSGALLRPRADAHPADDTTPAAPERDAGTGPDLDAQADPEDSGDPVVGRYNADSGFLPEADRAASTGRDG